MIAGTTTTKGLQVHAELDSGAYPTGVKVSDKQMAQLHLQRDEFHGEWNYELLPGNPVSMVTLFTNDS